MNPDMLLNQFIDSGLFVRKHDFAYHAYDFLMQKNNMDSLILITGSSFVVSDILKYLDKV